MSNPFLLYPLPEPKIKIIKQINDIAPNVRGYCIEKDGCQKVVPSVTTFLSNDSSYGLDNWRNDLGHQYADFVSEFSKYLGTMYHRSVEWYLKGHYSESEQHIAKDCFKNIKQLIGVELAVASWEYDFAGTIDLAYINHDNVLVLADNKTLHRVYPKVDESLDHSYELDRTMQSSKLTKYRKQLAAYGKALIETYDLNLTHNISEIWLFNTVTFTLEVLPVHGQNNRSTTVKSWEQFQACQAKFFESIEGNFLLEDTFQEMPMPASAIPF